MNRRPKRLTEADAYEMADRLASASPASRRKMLEPLRKSAESDPNIAAYLDAVELFLAEIQRQKPNQSIDWLAVRDAG